MLLALNIVEKKSTLDLFLEFTARILRRMISVATLSQLAQWFPQQQLPQALYHPQCLTYKG